MNRFLALEHANLFCGIGGDSNHLILTELQLPRMVEHMVDHMPGGAIMAMEVDMILEKLECTFVLAGIQPQVMELFHPFSPNQVWFNAFGFVRDQLDGTVSQAHAAMLGRLGSIEPEPWRKGSIFHTHYSIRTIMQYKLEVAGLGTIIDYDFYYNKFYVG